MEMVDQPSFSLYYYSMAFIFTVHGREKTFPKFRSMLQILILANVYVVARIYKCTRDLPGDALVILC